MSDHPTEIIWRVYWIGQNSNPANEHDPLPSIHSKYFSIKKYADDWMFKVKEMHPTIEQCILCRGRV